MTFSGAGKAQGVEAVSDGHEPATYSGLFTWTVSPSTQVPAPDGH
jgi:hypothetical protein